MKIKIALLACLNLAFGLNVAHAEHDSFWYAYPMPEAYLYVQDPLRYTLWSATYGHRQMYTPVYSPARSPVYLPVVRHYDRSRFRRRACEIRILAGHRQ
jgi:hypothetical protein